MEMSTVFPGAGLLRSSSKHSAHLLRCLSSPTKTLLFLSLTGHSVCLNVSVSFFVMSWSCFLFPLASASSASWAICSAKFLLSVLMFLFTSAFALVFCSCTCTSFFATLFWQLIIATFLTFLSCIFQWLYWNLFLLTRHSSTNHFFARIVHCLLCFLPI